MTLRLLHVSNSLCQFDIVDKGAMTKNGPLIPASYKYMYIQCTSIYINKLLIYKYTCTCTCIMCFRLFSTCI